MTYRTVGDLVGYFLGNGELTAERLKVYGEELDRISEEYAQGRADSGYNKEIREDLNELVGYLRNGLPDMLDRLKERGKDSKDYLKRFVRDNISPKTLKHPIPPPIAAQVTKTLEALV